MSALPPRPDLPSSASPLPPTPTAGPPPATWRWWEVILLYLAGNVLAGILLAIPIGARDLQASNGGSTALGIVAAMLTEVIVTVLFVLWLRRRHPRWVETVRLRPPRGGVARAVGVGVLLGLALYPAVTIVGGVLTGVFQSVVGRDVETPAQLGNHLGVGGAILAAVYALVIAPFAEEFFFRGLLFRSLRDRHGFWPGAIVSSLAFGLVHYVPAPWQDALLLQTIMVATGFGLALIYERRGTLLADWAAHATFNAIGLVAILTTAAALR